MAFLFHLRRSVATKKLKQTLEYSSKLVVTKFGGHERVGFLNKRNIVHTRYDRRKRTNVPSYDVYRFCIL